MRDPACLSSEDTVNQWIRFGMPPVIVYSAYFANTRYTNEATGEALELAYKILQRSQDSEKECLGWEFVSRGSRFVKVFTSRCPYEDNMVGLLDGCKHLIRDLMSCGSFSPRDIFRNHSTTHTVPHLPKPRSET